MDDGDCFRRPARYDLLSLLSSLKTRETREPTPADCWNWGKWRLKEHVHIKGSFLGWYIGLSCWYKRFLTCLGCSSRPKSSPTRTLFHFIFELYHVSLHGFLLGAHKLPSHVKPSRKTGGVSAERLEGGGPCILLKLRQVGIHGVHMKRVLPWLYSTLGSSCRYKRFCPAPAALVGPVQTFFSSPYNIKLYLSPSPSKLHGQAVLPRRLSLNMCL